MSSFVKTLSTLSLVILFSLAACNPASDSTANAGQAEATPEAPLPTLEQSVTSSAGFTIRYPQNWQAQEEGRALAFFYD